MNHDYRWLLWHWSGKAKDFRPLDAAPPPAHQAYAAGRYERLARLEILGPAQLARLQRCVLMEVERD
jgi:hypothetical protein